MLTKQCIENLIEFNEGLYKIQDEDNNYAVSEYFRGLLDAYKAILLIMEEEE